MDIKKAIYGTMIAVAVVTLVTLQVVDLPQEALPPGYSWHEDQALRLAVPVPAGWQVKRDEGRGLTRVFVTEDPVLPGGEFQTGYSVTLVPNLSRMPSGNHPSAYAAALIQSERANAGEILFGPWERELEPGVKESGIRIRRADGSAIRHYLIVADDKDDSIRIAIFTAPVARWPGIWQQGEVMMTQARFWKKVKSRTRYTILRELLS